MQKSQNFWCQEFRCPEKHFKAQKLLWPESPVTRRALVSSPPSTILKSQAFGSFKCTKADCSQGKKNQAILVWKYKTAWRFNLDLIPSTIYHLPVRVLTSEITNPPFPFGSRLRSERKGSDAAVVVVEPKKKILSVWRKSSKNGKSLPNQSENSEYKEHVDKNTSQLVFTIDKGINKDVLWTCIPQWCFLKIIIHFGDWIHEINITLAKLHQATSSSLSGNPLGLAHL